LPNRVQRFSCSSLPFWKGLSSNANAGRRIRAWLCKDWIDKRPWRWIA